MEEKRGGRRWRRRGEKRGERRGEERRGEKRGVLQEIDVIPVLTVDLALQSLSRKVLQLHLPVTPPQTQLLFLSELLCSYCLFLSSFPSPFAHHLSLFQSHILFFLLPLLINFTLFFFLSKKIHIFPIMTYVILVYGKTYCLFILCTML